LLSFLVSEATCSTFLSISRSRREKERDRDREELSKGSLRAAAVFPPSYPC